jgi:hypothetical protein
MIYVLAYVAMLLLRLSRAPGGYGLLLGVVFVFSAFRYEVGCDWTGYLNQYDVFGSLTFAEAVATREPLWTVLIGVQVKLGVPYPWLNVISSFMFFYGIHQLAKRQPDALGFLVLLFPVLILNMPMSGIRQGAAVGSCVWPIWHSWTGGLCALSVWSCLRRVFIRAPSSFCCWRRW